MGADGAARKKQTAAMETPAAAATNSAGLFGFESKIRRHVAALDLDLLGGGRRSGSRFPVESLERVGAIGHIFDGVFAVLVRDREVRMVEDTHPGKHPRMDVALELEEILGLGSRESQVRRLFRLGLVDFLVAGDGWQGMHVM